MNCLTYWMTYGLYLIWCVFILFWTMQWLWISLEQDIMNTSNSRQWISTYHSTLTTIQSLYSWWKVIRQSEWTDWIQLILITWLSMDQPHSLLLKWRNLTSTISVHYSLSTTDCQCIDPLSFIIFVYQSIVINGLHSITYSLYSKYFLTFVCLDLPTSTIWLDWFSSD